MGLRSGDKIVKTWLPLKDLKESDDAQIFPHLRWACFNPPVLGMFQFSPASLALLLLPFRQTFDNVTPKLQTRDIGESFIALDRPEVQKKSLPGNITLLLLISSKVMLSGNNFFSVDNNEEDRRTLQHREWHRPSRQRNPSQIR